MKKGERQLKKAVPVTKEMLKGINLEEKTPSRSMRTTFRISKEANDAMNWLVEQHGRKFKSIIDSICEDIPLGRKEISKDNLFIYLILNTMNKEEYDKIDRSIRKTVVISERSLNSLNKVASDYGMPRDYIIDRGIMLMKDIVSIKGEDKENKHRKALDMIEEFDNVGLSLEKKLQEELDSDDPIIQRFGVVIVVLENLIFAIQDELNSGKPIDPDGL